MWRLIFSFSLFIFFSSNLQAYCIYFTCAPEGISGQQQILSNISSVDSEIQKKLSDLSSKTEEERVLLDEILGKQAVLIDQSKQREILLQRIAQESSNISQLIRIQK